MTTPLPLAHSRARESSRQSVLSAKRKRERKEAGGGLGGGAAAVEAASAEASGAIYESVSQETCA
jgi:hypothetical protein